MLAHVECMPQRRSLSPWTIPCVSTSFCSTHVPPGPGLPAEKNGTWLLLLEIRVWCCQEPLLHCRRNCGPVVHPLFHCMLAREGRVIGFPRIQMHLWRGPNNSKRCLLVKGVWWCCVAYSANVVPKSELWVLVVNHVRQWRVGGYACCGDVLGKWCNHLFVS